MDVLVLDQMSSAERDYWLGHDSRRDEVRVKPQLNVDTLRLPCASPVSDRPFSALQLQVVADERPARKPDYFREVPFGKSKKVVAA